MNLIIRNYLSVIRRYKLVLILNILGLSVAFAVFLVIMIQLDYDYGFDKFHKNSDRIFRLESPSSSVISRPLAELFFESSPHIIAGSLASVSKEKIFFQIEKNGERYFFEEKSITVSPEFTNVFPFDFVEGSENALITPENVIISQSLSQRLFGKKSAVGEQIICDFGHLTVGAVYRDFPSNSMIENGIYFALQENIDKESWNISNYHVFIRIDHPSNALLLIENFKRNFDGKAVYGENYDWENWAFSLTVLPDIHFKAALAYDNTPKASKQVLSILFAIALIIVIIAAINFTNFTIAMTPMRIRNINTQRVMGASLHAIRFSLVFEAIIISLLSYLIAIVFVMIFKITPLARLIDADLSITYHPLIFVMTSLVAILTGFFSGAYPVRYITLFSPALVLKGNFGLSPQGKKTRNTLIGIQFVSSFVLIISISFMYLQNYFMQHSSLGYDTDKIIIANIHQILSSRDAFSNQLKSFPEIDDVTYSDFILSSADRYMGRGGPYKGELLSFQCLPVHYTFLKTMGIEIVEGRDFIEEDGNKHHDGVFIFNETAKKKYNLDLGSTIGFEGFGEIIGIISDIKFASFRMEVAPMAFYVGDSEMIGMKSNQYYAYIKLKAGTNIHAAMSHVYSSLAVFNPEFPFDICFFDEVLQRLYEKERSLISLISLFSMIAIFISIVGVFGLVVFDSECQRREIGIRKVYGASIYGIILLFNKAYFRIFVICFVIAAPLATYAVNRWLHNFAYKIPMYWWVYLFAFVVLGIITLGTVTFQNWRVANEDPIQAIKKE